MFVPAAPRPLCSCVNWSSLNLGFLLGVMMQWCRVSVKLKRDTSILPPRAIRKCPRGHERQNGGGVSKARPGGAQEGQSLPRDCLRRTQERDICHELWRIRRVLVEAAERRLLGRRKSLEKKCGD